MKISYVLPVYNSQSTIIQCINSLLKQTHRDFEIIVIDDCSSDYTVDLIRELIDGLGEDKEKVAFVGNEERKGAAYCRNFGNDMAKGDIVAVCDADLYYKKRGEAIVSFFESEEHKDKSVFYSALELKEDEHPIGYKGLMDAYEWDFKSKCPISHPTVAYKKEVVEKCKYHERSINTDLYEFFLLDVNKAGFKFGGCQDPLMLKIENNSTRNKTEAKKLKQSMYKEYGIDL